MYLSTSLDYCAYIFEVENVMLIGEGRESPAYWENSDINSSLGENHYGKSETVNGFVLGLFWGVF